jgi:hypothetical protein
MQEVLRQRNVLTPSVLSIRLRAAHSAGLRGAGPRRVSLERDVIGLAYSLYAPGMTRGSRAA